MYPNYFYRYLCVIACSLLLIACQPASEPQWALQGKTMGTTYHIKLVAPEQTELTETQLQQEIDQLLVDVNHAMSTYQPDSELSRFNQLTDHQVFPLSSATRTVVEESIRLYHMTDGALDITVGPLVNLWGFGPKARPHTIPDDELIEKTRLKTGVEKIQLTDEGITKTITDLYVDLSSIAKGYGVDVVAQLLERHGISNYLVEIGGEMRLSGHKLDGSDWRVAVEKPESMQRTVQQIISIGDNGIATSGDYRNYYEEDGIRYSHTIDPQTGKPIQHKLVSVTVVDPSCMTADGFATAINVMGFEKGKAFALEHNLAVLLINRENGQFKAYNTPAFEPYLR
ncbi:FAD:protein FMN transferase [Neptunicella sp. SCSIO 80796]|uniref:FAD:protein FMN transferase n=1 Tax=Neptunicella plasticusilytica TaxID=3117012 RepID=UPI003A4E488B